MNKKYKKSIYNLIDYNEEGRMGIYNLRTGGITVPEEKHIQVINEILESPEDFEEGNPLKKTLVKYRFLVPSDFDEKSNIKKRHIKSIEKNTQYIGFILIPAADCNFRCPYCFVYNYEDKIMSPEVFQRINKYIENKCLENPEGIDLVFNWFGGEPTLASKNIINFLTQIRNLTNKYKITFIDNYMATNGYLLNYKLFKKFTDLGIKKYQITLDGDKGAHNKNRFLKNGSGTFDVIYNNLLEIRDNVSDKLKFELVVRGNFLKTTKPSMESLKKMFFKDFGRDKRFHLYFHEVFAASTSREENDKIENDIFDIEEGKLHSDCLNHENIEKSFINKEYKYLYKALPRPRLHNCYVTNSQMYIINPLGKVYPCEGSFAEKNTCIGELEKNGNLKLNSKAEDWKGNIFSNSAFQECHDCICLPVCMGGCRRIRIGESHHGGRLCLYTEEEIKSDLRKYITHYLAKKEVENGQR